MKNDPNKRQVPVTYLKSGETRLSEPMPVHDPRPDVDSGTPASSEVATPGSLSQTERAAGMTSSSMHVPVEATGAQTVAAPADPEVEPVSKAPQPVEVGALVDTGQKGVAGGKPKVDIETLEQFIEYAYGRKGQRVTLKSKVEKLIAQNPRLDDAALSRLLASATGDTLLAVPRQILLLSRDIEGYPALRAALVSFVSNVMLRHEAFAHGGVQAALRYLPEAPPAAGALAEVLAFTPSEVEGKDPLRGADLQALRRNAASLFITWLANNRGMNTEELVALLFQVSWQPAARELSDDNARLRALTEVEQAAGVGLACMSFRQQAVEARTSLERALREANDLRVRLAESESQRASAEAQGVALQADLEALRQQTAGDVAELQRKHAEERTHLHHGQEQLGGRLVRRLDDAVETLEVGLRALRNKTPRVEVMVERAELVVDALKAEIKNLKEE